MYVYSAASTEYEVMENYPKNIDNWARLKNSWNCNLKKLSNQNFSTWKNKEIKNALVETA